MLWFAISLLREGVDRARLGREHGASALEWAVIAAIVVVAATAIGAAVYNIVQDKSSQLEDCANQPVGSAC
jgi:Flp pilus assembly pilin Flp